MAARQEKPSMQLEINDTGLLMNIFNNDDKEVDIWFDLSNDPKNGVVIGTGLTTKTALRDAQNTLRAAITEIENYLDGTK